MGAKDAPISLPYYYIRAARYLGGATPPWTLAGIKEPYQLVYDCFTQWAWEVEQEEIKARNLTQQPAGPYAALILGGKSLGTRPN